MHIMSVFKGTPDKDKEFMSYVTFDCLKFQSVRCLLSCEIVFVDFTSHRSNQKITLLSRFQYYNSLAT